LQAADSPRLSQSRYTITSQADRNYNCVAWAAQRDQVNWWQPGGAPYYYWPIARAPRSQAIGVYVEAFEHLGFRSCRSRHAPTGWQRVAIYTDGRGKFLHVAAQLHGDVWTSKLGQAEDIEHHTLEALEGGKYGHVTHVMRRIDPVLAGFRRTVVRFLGLIVR
jgi:hypothetical protein